MRIPIYYILYVILGILIIPVLPFYLLLRYLKGKETIKSFTHRFAFQKIKSTLNKTVHIHAVSVGELNSAMKLINMYKDYGYRVILTTTTYASAEIVKKKLSSVVEHYFFPYDILPIMLLFLHKILPDRSIFIESEIWPSYMLAAKIFNIPVYIVSARMSDRSMQRWQASPLFARTVLGMYAKILTQSSQDKQKFEDCLAYSKRNIVRNIGNLKYDTDLPSINKDILQVLESKVADYKVILAASTHEGEESIVLDAYKKLIEKHDKIKLIIAVRHNDRRNNVVNLVKSYGFSVELHSQMNQDLENRGIYIVDTIGEMGNFYSIADITIVCGSFIDGIGGHNPIEAAHFDTLITTGPYFANQKEIFENFFINNAAILMRNADDLIDIYEKFMEGKYDHYIENSKNLVKSYSNITSRIFNETQA